MLGGQVKFAVHLPEGEVCKIASVEPCQDVLLQKMEWMTLLIRKLKYIIPRLIILFW